jgi:hypothetical protein
MGSKGSNLDRLKDAGLIVKDPLPKPYADVIEGLSKEEVDTIVDHMQHPTILSLTQQLEKQRVDPPWFHVCIPPF